MPLMDATATIERFIAFVAGFKPGYESATLPGDVDQIEELEGLLGYALPPLHRAMLLRLGGSLGNLVAFESRDFSLELVLWSYRSPPWPLPRHLLLIGADIDDPALDHYLDLRRPTGDDYEVVSLPRLPEYPTEETAAKGFIRRFATLREMLFFSAFHGDRVRAMAHRRALYRHPEASESEALFDDIMVRLGATPIPELRGGHVMGHDSPDLAAVAHRGLADGLWQATLASNDRRRLAHVTEVFLDHGFLTTKE